MIIKANKRIYLNIGVINLKIDQIKIIAKITSKIIEIIEINSISKPRYNTYT